MLEDNGAEVVVYENCSGAKSVDELVDNAEDIYDALARRYLNIGCSCMTPNPNRFQLMGRPDRRIPGGRCGGCGAASLPYLQRGDLQHQKVRHRGKEDPYLSLETDYSTSDVGQLSTRLAAFVEML